MRDATGAPTHGAIELAQIRRGMFDEARRLYMAALEGLRPRGAAPRVGGGNAFDNNVEFIIDAAAGFAFGGFNELLANDPIIANFGWDFDNLTIFQGFPVDQPLAAAAAQRREDLTHERQVAAAAAVAAQGGARGVGVATYVELATQNTDDPQNAHDTGVLACLRAIVERLRADQADAALPGPDEVMAEIRARGGDFSEGRAHRVTDVEEVIARTKNGERVIAIGATDAECLGRVCWEEGVTGRKIVCVNGRISRLLSALILLDWDKRNWEVKKLEQFKNDIYAAAAAVIAAEAEQAANSSDPDMRRAGRLHLARSAAEATAIGEPPKAVSDQLAEKMRTAIGAMVDSYVRNLEEGLGVKGAIPTYMIASVTEEAKAAVG
jgi:hypothetical protein